MKSIESLIDELCPNGVVFVSIGSVAEVGTGSSNGNEAEEFGEYPFYIRSQSIKRKNNYEYDEEAIIIPGEGGIGEIYHYVNGKYALHQRVYRIHFNDSTIDTKFAYYYMAAKFKGFIMKKAVSATVTSIRKPMIQEFRLPVPPLEVQREIVHILDSFTLLTAELTAELTARKKQYEYYRNHLLTFDTSVKSKKLGEIFEFRNGLSKGKDFFGRGIPFIRYTDVYNNRSLKKEDITALVECTPVESEKLRVTRGDVLFTRTSETAEDVGWSSVMLDDMEECVFNGFTIKATPITDDLVPEYCAFCFSTDRFRKYVTSHCAFTTRASLTGSTIAEYEMPIPSHDVQKRIANILNNFEAICNDLNIGLPAEIEARKKQYEYYRDMLLTFVESGEIISNRQTDRQSIIKLLQYVFGVVFVRLEDIATITRGGSFQKKDFCEQGVPCIHYGQIYTKFGIYADSTIQYVTKEVAEKSKTAVKNDIIMAVTSENVDDVCKCVAWIGEDDIAVSGHTAIIHHNQNAKYLSYYFHTDHFYKQKKKLAHGTKVIEVTPDKLNDIIIPLPCLEEQERIVAILDRFDALCNDLSNGLPAEIEARRKQYEYYRDKLLTFKELSE